jgi:hypothetical protein
LWEVPPGIASVNSIGIDPSAPDTIIAAFESSYMSFYTGAVLRSDDGGMTWRTGQDGSKVGRMVPKSVAFLQKSIGGSEIFVAWSWNIRFVERSLFKYIDAEDKWENLTKKLPGEGVPLPKLLATPEGMLFANLDCFKPKAGERACLYASNDKGQSWAPLPALSEEINDMTWGGASQTLYVATRNGVWKYRGPGLSRGNE